MAIELKFSRPGSAEPWGFRLVGGADFNEPLVVVKVNKDSYAENAGLMVGDVIVRINNTPTAGITHAAAHGLIHEAGNNYVVAVRRGLFSDIPVPSEEENNNDEVNNILQNSLAEHIVDIQKDQTIGPKPKLLENLAGQEQLVSSTESKKVGKPITKPKKFSTFLVKPRNPKPVPKKLPEERKIIGEPYRVKIIKQPRRNPDDVLNRKKSVKFDSHVTEVEISREGSIADSIDSLEITEFKNYEEMDIETSEQINEETTVEISQVDEENDDKNSDIAENDSLENQKIQYGEEINVGKSKPILKPPPLDIHIDPVVCETSLPLEEQLAAVQKQLLALSQLPSAIQVTLEAVTQQLNKIVSNKINKEEENEYEENKEPENGNENVDGSEENVEEVINENLSISENAEGDITDNEVEENLEELEEDRDFEGGGNKSDEDTNTLEPEEEDNNVISDPYAGMTEEEKEAKVKEEQLMAKKQKLEEERRKMDWTQRPIVLPGGRKWTDPDDATPKPRTPKMSDEKICKTIEDCSEVIVGKTKGINFLKYQPPAKNLDYLQKSEVYRLIHGMETPVKGVGTRAEKILSEKDYYGVNGAP